MRRTGGYRLRLADVDQRTLFAARVVDWRRQFSGSQHGVNGGDSFCNLLAQFRRDGNFAAAARGVVKDRAFQNRFAEHLFQAHRLCGQLQVVMYLQLFPAMFVFHRVDMTIGVKLDHIAFTHQPKTIRPYRQCAFAPHPLESLKTLLIHPRMRRIAAHGVNVLVEGLFQMNQGALARALAPVLERGKHDGVVCFAHGGKCYHSHASTTFTEGTMGAMLEELENQALQLSPKERGELIHRLIVSLESEPEDTPEAIAKAWDEEIARRVADMEAGKTVWIPAEEVFARLDAIIENAR